MKKKKDQNKIREMSDEENPILSSRTMFFYFMNHLVTPQLYLVTPSTGPDPRVGFTDLDSLRNWPLYVAYRSFQLFSFTRAAVCWYIETGLD